MLGGALVKGSWGSEPERRPNVVLILADDVGRDWIGCYGGTGNTPNIDEVAREGVRFETVWATPLCTPSRHEMLTGRYPCRTGWTEHHDVPRWGGTFDAGRETTFARLLRNAGYATGIGGKWQLNDLAREPHALLAHGFDEHCVWPGGERNNPASDQRYWDPFLQINGQRKVHVGRFGEEVVCDWIVEFMRRHRGGHFLAYYPMLVAHAPYTITPLDRGHGQDARATREGNGHGQDARATGEGNGHGQDARATEGRRPVGRATLYAGMIRYMDAIVGRVVGAIKELGIERRTVVIFAGDNGSSVSGTIGGKPYPAGKGALTNAGVQVPLVVRAPMLADGGRVSTDLVDFSDFFPTILELAGVRPPQGLALDGRSFVRSISGDRPELHKRGWIYSQLGSRRIVRDERWMFRSDGVMWDLQEDPLESVEIREPGTGEYAGPFQAMMGVLAGMPKDARPPFEPFGQK